MANTIESRKPRFSPPLQMVRKVIKEHIKSIETEVVIDDIERIIYLSKGSNTVVNDDFAEENLTLLSKYTLKAVNEGRSERWLDFMYQILEQSEHIKFENNYLRFDVYLSIYRCLNSINLYDWETEDAIQKAIHYAPDVLSKVKASVTLAQYYQDTSHFSKMKNVLDELSGLIKAHKKSDLKTDEAELYITRLLLLYGQYYFYCRNFKVSSSFFVSAKELLERLYSKTNSDLIWRYKDLSICLHYLGRVEFECKHFEKSIDFYQKSQNQLDIALKRNFIVERIKIFTAFNHLRKGQSKFMLRDFKGAKLEYEEAYQKFWDDRDLAGMCHVEIAQTDLVGNTSFEYSKKEIFLKKEQILSNILTRSLQDGYDRIYLLAALKLTGIYIKNIKIVNAIKIILSSRMLHLIKKNLKLFLLSLYWVIKY